MRLSALVAAAGVAVLLASGCSSGFDDDRADARKGGSLIVGVAEAPDSLDPAVGRSPEALRVLWLAFTPPMTYRHSGGADGTKLIPGLAAKAPKANDEKTEFSFRFRRGLRYSDGTALRASDFDRALRRARTLNPAARARLGEVTGVQTDDRTRSVTVALRAPDPTFPRTLAETWAAPVSRGTPMRRVARGPVAGIGSYYLNRTLRGQAYSLSRRDDFSLPGIPAGNADAITGRVIPAAASRSRQALGGRIDATQGDPPTADLPRIRSEDKDRYREFRTLQTRAVTFDLGSRPFNDEDARRAVAYALDIQTLARLEEGFLTPACNVLAPQVSGYRALDPCPFGQREGDSDLVRASQLVTKSRAGRTRVTVDGGSGPYAAALGRYGVETLRKIGMRARLARTPGQARRAQLRFATIAPAEPAPAGYFAGIDDAGVASDVGVLERSSTPSAAAAQWAEIDRTVVSGALVAPFGTRTVGILLSRRMDAANCVRFSPVYGMDLSSFCLK